MVCTWQSHRTGNTDIPPVEMISASGGGLSVSTVPIAVIRSPSIIMTLLASGGPPKPSINRPPTRAIGLAKAPTENSRQRKATMKRKVRVIEELIFASCVADKLEALGRNGGVME